MKKREKLTLVAASVIIGILSGIVVVSYRLSLDYVVGIRNDILNNSKILLLCIFFIFSAIIQWMLNQYPLISGSGIPQVMALVSEKIKFTWFFELLYKFISGVLAIFMGMSLGREGPSIHLGALISDGFIKIFKISDKYKNILLTSGACAGLSAAFNAPLAATMFGIEELNKKISPVTLICAITASLFSNIVGNLVLGKSVVFNSFNWPNPLPYTTKNVGFELVNIFILSIIIILFGILFNYTLLKMQDIYKSIKINNYIKMLGVAVVSLIVVMLIPEITGGGHSLVEHLANHNDYTFMFLLALLFSKLIFTMFSYGTGAAGGIFLPMLVIGALIGKIYAIVIITIFGLPEYFIVYCMILSMVAYFTAVVKAPITGIILMLEMTGNFSYLLAMIIAAVFTYTASDILNQTSIYEKLYRRMLGKEDK